MSEMEGLDTNNVISWEGRPRRVIKPRKPTYWEEYVTTDPWYRKSLVEDIPPEEMWAALEDEDLDDAGEEGDEELDCEEMDDDYIEPIAPGAMWEHELSDDNLTDEEDEETERTNSGSSTDTTAEEEEV